MRDSVMDSKLVAGYSPLATASADNTALVAASCDRSGYDIAELIIILGTLADVDATFTLLMEESANNSTWTTVAAADMIGTIAGATFLFSSDNKVVKIGYKGLLQYVRLTVTPAANTGAVPIGMCWRLSGAKSLPLSTQIT